MTNVGIIGFGFVGRAIAHGFSLHAKIKIYDKYDNIYDSIESTVNCSDFIFVAVPTPMNEDGSQDASNLEDAIENIVKVVKGNKTVIIKSTIIPGTTRKLAERFPQLSFVFSPEFLTQRAAKIDFINSSRIVLGGEKEIVDKVEKFHRERFTYTPIFKTTWEGAELVKYMNNCFFATKIAFCNEFYDMAKAVGVPYNELRDMWLADGRIANSHTDVPGHDGFRGYGGKCLVPGTKLLFENKLVNIEEIKIGDSVFDGDSYTNITKIGNRVVDSLISIKSRGRAIIGSNDHIHMIYEKEKLVEKQLKDINIGDYIFIPKIKIKKPINSIFLGKCPNGHVKKWEEESKITKDIARLFGLYLAEGCMTDDKYLTIWSFGEKEEFFADEVVNILKKVGLNSRKVFQISNGTYGISRCWLVKCRSIWLQTLFKKMGSGKNSKTKNTMLFNEEISKIVIGSWLDGDGSYYDGTVQGYSESRSLISKIDTMFISLGILCQIGNDGRSIKISMRDDTKEVCSWTTRLKFNNERYKRDFSYESTNMRRIKNGWISKIREIKKISGHFVVYSIETESHKYVANNVLTHNCFPKDIEALINWAESKGLHATTCSAAQTVNSRVREKKDWENIVGAVSSNNYVKKEGKDEH